MDAAYLVFHFWQTDFRFHPPPRLSLKVKPPPTPKEEIYDVPLEKSAMAGLAHLTGALLVCVAVLLCAAAGNAEYTVEFAYGAREYVLPGGGAIPLADLLAELDIPGEAEAWAVSDPTLFDVRFGAQSGGEIFPGWFPCAPLTRRNGCGSQRTASSASFG